jgi:hypothetical protein
MVTVPAVPPQAKVDFRRTLDGYHAKLGEFRSLVVPPLQYLMVDGHGDPNQSTSFGDAVSTLCPVAYAMKFTSKQELGRDYVVPPLEGLWWAEDMSSFTARRDKAAWSRTLMLLTPDWLDSALLGRAIDTVARTKTRPAQLEAVRLSSLDEGLCVQTLHVGPFDVDS